MIHEIFGGVQCYLPLARALGEDQPVYAFRSVPHNHHRSIEQIASIYLRALRAFDPTGPYFLGGYSFGGQVAFEMARQLRAEGHNVGPVFLFDSYIPGSDRRLTLLEQTKIFLRNTRDSGVPYVVRKIDNKWRYWKRGTIRALLNLLGSVCKVLNLDRPQSVLNAEGELANRRAFSAYRPVAYEGPVVLMLSEDRQDLISKRGDPFQGWGILADKGLEICTIPSDHVAFLDEPSVQTIARIVRCRLSHSAKGTGNIMLR